MPGISDSGSPDDIRVHLEEIISADDAQQVPVEGESQRDIEIRTSVLLPPATRALVETSLAQVSEAVPGLSNAETKKLLATRAGRDALDNGREVLSRVDSHLESVTQKRNPQIGRNYGVYGRNPVSFAGVYRALEQSVLENQRLQALPTDAPERAYLFTPLIARLVVEARDHLRAVMGERLTTRSELSSKVELKSDVINAAQAAISAARNHLYANLPDRKKDPDLRNYGFRPIRGGRPRRDEGEEEE